ncbi:hypothetical protein SAMN05216412_11029 [Nitrosospira multiformis]|uniref:Uncharacterized protein n=1 Tax=Nitrosospira multiformis TaxID=1231 RepID=A0A1I0FSD5_9PROT|nr:hypothetical protein SAMN05216412_11029 [Nitrosospira multiformis]
MRSTPEYMVSEPLQFLLKEGLSMLLFSLPNVLVHLVYPILDSHGENIRPVILN